MKSTKMIVCCLGLLSTMLLASDKKGSGAAALRPFRLEVSLADPKPVWVGDTMHEKVIITNVTERAFTYSGITILSRGVNIQAFPGEDRALSMLSSNVKQVVEIVSGTVTHPTLHVLQPGESSVPIAESYKVMMPGKGDLYVAVTVHDADGKRTSVSSTAKFVIRSDMSDDMRKRFDQAAAEVADDDLTLDEKLKTLRDIAAEKHYFAAQFVRKVWRETSDPAIKNAAFDHLLSLLEFGTAYEALPDIVKVLEDEKTKVGTKSRILEVLTPFRMGGEYAGINIAGQAYYRIPEQMLVEIRKTLKKIAEGDDVALATKARAALEAGMPKEAPAKKEKPAGTATQTEDTPMKSQEEK